MSEHATGRRRSVRGSMAIAVALLGAGAVTPLAWSDDPPTPPPEGPAISQYVETVPSGTGGQAVGVGTSRTKPLPKPAAKKLVQKKTPLAPKLRSIATSSSYGAPQQTLPRHTAPAAKPAETPAQAPKRHPQPRVHRPKPRPEPAPAKPAPAKPAPAEPARSRAPDRTAMSAAVSAATGGGDRTPLILLGAIVLFTTAAGLAAAARRARQAR